MRNRAFVALSGVIVVLLTACQGSLVSNMVRSERSKTLSDAMHGWVGKPESELVTAWGPPDSSYDNRDGSVVVSWKQPKSRWNEERDRYDNWDCEKIFLVDSEGIISKWKHMGCSGWVDGVMPADVPIPQPTL